MPLERVLSMIRSGEIGRETLIWNETFDEWIAANHVDQLEKFFPPPLPTVAVDVTRPPAHSPVSQLDTVQTNPANRTWEPPTQRTEPGKQRTNLDEELTIEAPERSLRALDAELTIEASTQDNLRVRTPSNEVSDPGGSETG